MRKLFKILILLLSLFTGVLWVGAQAWAADKDSDIFYKGETVTYSIKKMGIKAGTATLSFDGRTTLEGREAVLILFTAKGLNFYDEEKIYVDPVTFLPIRVVREVDYLGKNELITEFYSGGKVRIVKIAGGKTEEQVIEKEKHLDNLYGFIFRYRRSGSFELGDSLNMNLPTMDVTVKLTEYDEIKAGGEKHTAYFLESDPKKYKVWFSRDQHRVPLRIDGGMGFGGAAMIMNDYSPGKNETQAGLTS